MAMIMPKSIKTSYGFNHHQLSFLSAGRSKPFSAGAGAFP
jgi:hypothetical protein